MTTRGQKRLNDATTSSTSESGTILNMLVSNQPEILEIEAQTDPATAKDVSSAKDGPAIAKNIVKTTRTTTIQAIAKETG